MAEGEKTPSLMDNSPEALMARYKSRIEANKDEPKSTKGGVLLEPPIKQVAQKSASTEQGNMEQVIADLARSIQGLETGLARGEKIDEAMLTYQKEQLEMWAGGGYDAFVSAEDAQVAIDPRLFETQPQAWYRNLNENWQEVMRARIAILMGCYPKRARGHLDLAVMAENADVRIDRGALDFMWREMPGFRIAMATIVHDLFEIREEVPPGLAPVGENKVWLMVLQESARQGKKGKEWGEEGVLGKFAEYKKKLISNLEKYFEENSDLLKANDGAPHLTTRVAARAAVASAWNLFFVSNAVDSGDQGDLSKLEKVKRIANPTEKEYEDNPTRGRKVTNPVVYAEQARAMMLPWDKAYGKSIREEGKVGTEETWLGDLGDYIAERNRHDSGFKRQFYSRERRIVPQRLFASWFDLTTFVKGPAGIEISVGRKLCGARKRPVGTGSLYDFSRPKQIDFSKLSSSELWGEYSDTWDSARKIYEMIGGKNPLKMENIEVWRQTLANALSKVRGTPLAPYYRDPELLVSCVAGSVGLTEFASDYLLPLSDVDYDALSSQALNDDRLFAGMPGGSRKYVFESLNAYDQYSVFSFVKSLLSPKRLKIRRAASFENARWRAR